MPMTHDEARRKVCAICCNNRGVKACREVSKKEEGIKGYNRKIPYLPSGICKGCLFDLRCLTEGRPVKLNLSESYDCALERQTRSGWNLCTCRWCSSCSVFQCERRHSQKVDICHSYSNIGITL